MFVHNLRPFEAFLVILGLVLCISRGDFDYIIYIEKGVWVDKPVARLES